MDISLPTPLLGGLTPQAFMRRHWQKKPLLVRGAAVPDVAAQAGAPGLAAVAGTASVIGRAQLFELASREGVESRLVRRSAAGGWALRQGPFARRALPPVSQGGWTLLVQGVDLHLPAADALRAAFRFLPDARLDDLMVSYASDGGGVGPHVDSYDVFLLQLQGRRRWRVAPLRDPALLPGLPLKILAHFEAQDEWLLDAGDMLYLPPGWAHDGQAVGECLTASIGFRAPARDELARELLQRSLDAEDLDERGPLYRDPTQPATDAPARIPAALQAFGAAAVQRLLNDRAALDCALGEVLSEPKPGVWFEPPLADGATVARADGATTAASVDGSGMGRASAAGGGGLHLDAKTRMLYDDRCVFINGESFRAAGRDARLMRSLADRRSLVARDRSLLSSDARSLVDQWLEAGWLREGA